MFYKDINSNICRQRKGKRSPIFHNWNASKSSRTWRVVKIINLQDSITFRDKFNEFISTSTSSSGLDSFNALFQEFA